MRDEIRVCRESRRGRPLAPLWGTADSRARYRMTSTSSADARRDELVERRVVGARSFAPGAELARGDARGRIEAL
jgi:hypothetical protein